jgi:hypothetical protein
MLDDIWWLELDTNPKKVINSARAREVKRSRDGWYGMGDERNPSSGIGKRLIR